MKYAIAALCIACSVTSHAEYFVFPPIKQTPAATGRPAAAQDPAIRAIVDEAAHEHGIDQALFRAIIEAESSFNPRAVSRAGAVGLGQLMQETAARYGVTDRADPKQNAAGAAKYLRWLLDHFGGNTIWAIASYNAGEGDVEKYKGIPPYPETRAYVRRVLALCDCY